MNKGKIRNLNIILSVIVLFFAIAGFCMVFLPMLKEVTVTSIFGVTYTTSVVYPGLGVIFGGTHDVITTISSGSNNVNTSISTDFVFNIVGFLGFLLPLLGAILVVANKFVTKKVPIFSIVGLILMVVGIVLLFFVPSYFKNINGMDNSIELQHEVGLLMAIVLYGCLCITSLIKIFFIDFNKN